MNTIKAISNPRKSMQRVGFLKHLVWRASKSNTNSASSLGTNLLQSATKKISVELNADIKEYINRVLTPRQYDDMRKLVASVDKAQEMKIDIELQDYYLSDPSLPSRRGKLVEDDWNRYVHLAIVLGLLRAGTYSITSRGNSFLSILEEGEKISFEKLEGAKNPFQLSSVQKGYFLHRFIWADGDILKFLYPILLNKYARFTDREAGDYLPMVFRQLANSKKNRINTGDDIAQIQRLIDTAKLIEKVSKHPNPGGKNAREHAISVRLEPYVDLGLIFKPDPFVYEYELTNSSRVFFTKLIESQTIDAFLNKSFFHSLSMAFGIDSTEKKDDNRIIQTLSAAYPKVKSQMGYASLEELGLLTGLFFINSTTPCIFELNDTENWLRQKQQESPSNIKFNVDRQGQLAYVRLTEDFFKQIH